MYMYMYVYEVYCIVAEYMYISFVYLRFHAFVLHLPTIHIDHSI